ncbi:DoxX family protein [Aurantimonas sp. 22II-16-19i]|uniref:DoxX family protein n=1 Tax=Aurantimonas sp. 22II-16-19i TaxID=1317114 RepID=UPI0009F7A8A9|nr:DoxX family protein [Aurantimonas sp. 22II-16-19i]ORE93321.1 DoxX family protein [Aurantimonas sp. 22II-16-19i]
MTTPAPIAALLGNRAFIRAAVTLLTLPYWSSGIRKLFDLDGALGEARNFGLEPAALIVMATILVQIGGSLLLVFGRMVWLGAGALGVFTAAATVVAHAFWTVSDPMERFHATNTFLEHAGLIGGLILATIIVETREALA